MTREDKKMELKKKKVIIVLFTLFASWTAGMAINYPTYNQIGATSVYETTGSYQQVSFSSLQAYQPTIDGDGYTVTPSGVSSGPRRAAGVGERCPSRRDGGDHEFVDGVCKYCHQTHNHYDGDGNKCCDICGHAMGSGAGTPGSDASEMIPIGSALLPLLLLALGYGAVVYRRKLREA